MTPVPLPGSVSRINNCYPTPFNPKTTIAFQMESAGWAQLVVFDTRGRRAAVLCDGHYRAGTHKTSWDSGSDGESIISSGVYLAVLRTADGVAVRKLVLAK